MELKDRFKLFIFQIATVLAIITSLYALHRFGKLPSTCDYLTVGSTYAISEDGNPFVEKIEVKILATKDEFVQYQIISSGEVQSCHCTHFKGQYVKHNNN